MGEYEYYQCYTEDGEWELLEILAIKPDGWLPVTDAETAKDVAGMTFVGRRLKGHPNDKIEPVFVRECGWRAYEKTEVQDG